MSNEITDLDRQIAELTAKKQAIINSKRQEALQEARNLIGQFSLTAAELGLQNKAGKSGGSFAGGSSVKAPPKYANPDNSGDTWAGGKGARPKWVKAHLAKGGNLDDLLIVKL